MRLVPIDMRPFCKALYDHNELDDVLSPEEIDAIRPSRFWDDSHGRPIHSTPGWSTTDSVVPARNQSDRRTCVSFALVAALEARLQRRGIATDLSEQHVAAALALSSGRSPDDPYELIRLFDAIHVLRGRKICFEEDCKYEAVGSEPGRDALSRAQYSIEDFFVIPRLPHVVKDRIQNPNLDGGGVGNIAYLECVIANGYDIVVAIAANLGRDMDTGIIFPRYVSLSNALVPEASEYSHALLITGYRRNSGIPYFICRDSLERLSEGRPLCVSYEYVRAYAKYGVVVTHVGIG